jgi:hypothetical protein
LDSYKTAKERFNNTGAGLEGIAFNKFQDYVYANVCKYYEQLDPVMKDRPNVYPVYTNTSDVDDEDDSIVVSNHSNEEARDDCTINISNVAEIPITVDLSSPNNVSMVENLDSNTASTPSKQSTHLNTTEVATTSNTNNTEVISNLNTSSISDITVCDTPSSCDKSNQTKSTKSTSTTSNGKNGNKLSPIMAKNKLKSQLRDNKLQIHGESKNNNMNNAFRMTEEEDRAYMRECRKKKLDMEQKQHYDMLLETKEKRKLEQRRLEMDLKSNELKQEQMKIEKTNSKIRQQTDAIVCEQEKNKLLLIKMKVFQQRKELEKENPDLNDNFWDCDIDIE